ncbi:unnamed protein product [Closterium sp. NIES-53]
MSQGVSCGSFQGILEPAERAATAAAAAAAAPLDEAAAAASGQEDELHEPTAAPGSSSKPDEVRASGVPVAPAAEVPGTAAGLSIPAMFSAETELAICAAPLPPPSFVAEPIPVIHSVSPELSTDPSTRLPTDLPVEPCVPSSIPQTPHPPQQVEQTPHPSQTLQTPHTPQTLQTPHTPQTLLTPQAPQPAHTPLSPVPAASPSQLPNAFLPSRRIPQVLTGRPASSLLLHSHSTEERLVDPLVYHRAPPSLQELRDTWQAHGLPRVQWPDVYYGDVRDVPERHPVFGGKEFKSESAVDMYIHAFR